MDENSEVETNGNIVQIYEGYLCVLPTDGNEGQIVINPKEMIIENNETEVLENQGYTIIDYYAPQEVFMIQDDPVHDSSWFECASCPMKFPTLKKMEEHIETHEPPEGIHKCTLCNKSFDSSRKLTCHLYSHKNLKNVNECKNCNKKFSSIGHLNKHMRKCDGLDALICKICLKVFKFVSQLKRHAEVHQEAFPYTCDVCGRGFRYERVMRRHKDLHNNSKKYTCKMCGDMFQTTGKLTHHLIGFHGITPKKTESKRTKRSTIKFKTQGKKSHERVQCKICERYLTNKHLLKIHVYRHMESKPFRCDTCGNEFYYKWMLKDHSLEHGPHYNYICNQCNEKFKSKEALKKHTLVFHKTYKDRYKRQCKICGKHLPSEEALKEHSASHDPNEIFECSFCSKIFYKLRSLNLHKQKHYLNIFQCDCCFKKFKSKKSLNVHMNRFHKNIQSSEGEEDKKFKCEKCNCKFTFYRSYRLHRLKHNYKSAKNKEKTKIKTEKQDLNEMELFENQLNDGNVFIKKENQDLNELELLKEEMENQLINGNISVQELKKPKSECTEQSNMNLLKILNGDNVFDKKQRKLNREKLFNRKISTLRKKNIIGCNGKYQWKCYLCRITFISSRSTRNHLKIFHKSDKIKWRCEICHGNFPNSSYLFQHVYLHSLRINVKKFHKKTSP